MSLPVSHRPIGVLLAKNGQPVRIIGLEEPPPASWHTPQAVYRLQEERSRRYRWWHTDYVKRGDPASLPAYVYREDFSAGNGR